MITAPFEATLTVDPLVAIALSHALPDSDRAAKVLALDVKEAWTACQTAFGPMVTNAEAKAIFLEDAGIDALHETAVLCPRCARRGRRREVGHNHDWHVCHLPFWQHYTGRKAKAPLETLELGCHTCNREDRDWAS